MTLDDPNQVQPDESASLKATVLRYGLIGGLVLIIYGLIGFLTGLSSPGNLSNIFINLVLALVITVGLVVLAIRHHRDQGLGGHITFGRAFLVGFLTIIIAGVISLAFNYLYLSFVEPDYLANMANDMQAMYERMGLSEEQIEEAMKRVEDMTPASMIVQGLISQSVMGAIVGAIVAAIMKRKPE